MKRILNVIFCMVITSSTQSVDAASTRYGICCVPVADLTVKPVNLTSYTSAYTDHTHFMLGNYQQKKIARISQLLLNDQVIVLEETDTEYKIQTPDQAYANATYTYNRIYYIDKQAVALTATAPKSGQKLFVIKPLFIPELGVTVSAGTNFTVVKKIEKSWLVTAVHPKDLKTTLCTLDAAVCCQPYTDKKKKRAAFTQLVRFWAQQTPKKIPYVLGGSSIIETVIPTNFTLHSTGYMRTGLTYPYSGLDCAHLIFLAARMTGVAITTTNTIGQSKECKLFTKNDTLEDGDLVFWKGHVIIITDVKKGLLAEARGYGAGYGVIHEIALQEQFKEIKTSQDLLDAYFNKQALTRLDKAGNVEHMITDVRVYKLPV